MLESHLPDKRSKIQLEITKTMIRKEIQKLKKKISRSRWNNDTNAKGLGKVASFQENSQ